MGAHLDQAKPTAGRRLTPRRLRAIFVEPSRPSSDPEHGRLPLSNFAEPARIANAPGYPDSRSDPDYGRDLAGEHSLASRSHFPGEWLDQCRTAGSTTASG